MAGIRLQDVSKRYPDGTLAVDAVSLDVVEGEFVVLVGPSGCGKSTLLNMVAGLEEVTDGTIAIDGQVINDLPPRDRNIAMVFQSYALYPHMTVRRNMSFPLELAGMGADAIRDRVEQVAAMLELTPHLDRRPASLSGGQRQRVAMGRAIVRRPRAFLMDEPLSNLDARLRVQTRRQIAAIQRTLGVTTLYVTHDQTEAMTLGDRVVVLRNGVVQQVGPPRALYDSPANLFVASFIGSPSMNFLPGTIEGDVLRSALGDLPLPAVLPGGNGAVRAARRDVILGIRPEHFRTAGDAGDRAGASDAHHVDVHVHAVESLGSDIYAYFTLPGTAAGAARFDVDDLAPAGVAESGPDEAMSGAGSPFIARLDAESRVRQGEAVQLRFDSRNVHVFDSATRLRSG
jgi:multiple sugar transport system ATP-binding protein